MANEMRFLDSLYGSKLPVVGDRGNQPGLRCYGDCYIVTSTGHGEDDTGVSQSGSPIMKGIVEIAIAMLPFVLPRLIESLLPKKRG